jgi:hypothetical protein
MVHLVLFIDPTFCLFIDPTFTSGYVLMLNGQLFLGAANVSPYLLCPVLKLSSLPLVPWFRKSSSFAGFLIILFSNSPTPINPRALLVAVIVLNILISASILFMMHASKAFFSFRKSILNLMVQIS